MKTPPRVELPTSRESFAQAIRTAATRLARDLGGPQWAGEWTPSYHRTALNNAAIRAYVNPCDPEIATALELAACAAAAAHLAELTPGTDPIQVPAPGGRWAEVIRTGGRPKDLQPPTQWRTGVLAAVITRNADVLGVLTAIRVEDLLRITRPRAPNWFEAEARALQSLFRRETQASDRLLEAMELARSDRMDQEWPREIVAPEMELGIRALARDLDKFDASMLTAIERHHHYYENDGKDDLLGQLALAPLAMACLAHDANSANVNPVTTTVESDYTPRWLIERTQP